MANVLKIVNALIQACLFFYIVSSSGLSVAHGNSIVKNKGALNELISKAENGDEVSAVTLYKYYFWELNDKDKALSALLPAVNAKENFHAKYLYSAWHLNSLSSTDVEKIKSAIFLERIVNSESPDFGYDAAYMLAEYFHQKGDDFSFCYYEKAAIMGSSLAALYLSKHASVDNQSDFKKLYDLIGVNDKAKVSNYPLSNEDQKYHSYGDAIFYDYAEYNKLKKIVASIKVKASCR